MHGHLAAAAKCPAVEGLTLLSSDESEGRDAAHHFGSLLGWNLLIACNASGKLSLS